MQHSPMVISLRQRRYSCRRLSLRQRALTEDRADNAGFFVAFRVFRVFRGSFSRLQTEISLWLENITFKKNHETHETHERPRKKSASSAATCVYLYQLYFND